MKIYYQNPKAPVFHPEYEKAYIGPLTGLAHGSKLGKSTTFANSLLGQHKKSGGKLSPAQWAWVKKLVDGASNRTPKPELSTEAVGDFSGVIALFATAKNSKLKYPKITMHDENGNTIQLSMAGAKAKKPGSINVTDGGKFGSNIWYGRVLADGTWEQSSKATREVGNLLKELSANPAAFAFKHGEKHGHCCFCNKKLTQENSMLAGFGPVCADNWGLKNEWNNAVELSLD